MNRRNIKRNLNKNKIPKKIMRCNYSQRIVWDNECCKDFVVKVDSLNQENCKNCRHSF